MCFNMLKNCGLSPSPWHICIYHICCYLRSTHRLHPMLAALWDLFVHQWRATAIPKSPRGWEIAEKAIGNVITLYKPWCKEAEKICSMIQTNVKLLIFNYCRDKWHNSIRNRQEAIRISVSVPGMWPADAKCPSRIGLFAAHGKIQGSVEEIS